MVLFTVCRIKLLRTQNKLVQSQCKTHLRATTVGPPLMFTCSVSKLRRFILLESLEIISKEETGQELKKTERGVRNPTFLKAFTAKPGRIGGGELLYSLWSSSQLYSFKISSDSRSALLHVNTSQSERHT